jgi:hypothetical protein
MPIRYAAAVLASSTTALLAACSMGHDDGPPDLVVHATEKGAIFTEGALPEVRLVDEDGRVWTPDHDLSDPAEFSGVPEGRYQLRAALRPCDGACNRLDPPELRCAAAVRIGHDRELWVRWSASKPCRISSA